MALAFGKRSLLLGTSDCNRVCIRYAHYEPNPITMCYCPSYLGESGLDLCAGLLTPADSGALLRSSAPMFWANQSLV